MQLNSSYLYPNKIQLYGNLDQWKTERYHQVYQRPYYLYRGVDNKLDLHIKNSDQKDRNVTGYDVVFSITAVESGELVARKDCTAYDITTGRFFVEFNEQEVFDMEPGFYNFSVYAIRNGVKQPLYGDSKHGAAGQIEVIDKVFGEVKESRTIDTFLETGAGTNVYLSEVFDAKPQFNQNQALHTFAFYLTNYTGDITIQGTLENTTDPANWIDIETTSYASQGITYKNVTGVWSQMRISHTLANGTVDKILYRY